jgi:hypothetical protein
MKTLEDKVNGIMEIMYRQGCGGFFDVEEANRLRSEIRRVLKD